MKSVLIALGMLALTVTGCGDDGGNIDAAVSIDADVTPDAGPDANMAAACETMCSCAALQCAQDMTDCLAECAQLPASAVTCRNIHCNFAISDPSVHCPHVAGDPAGPGTPPDCIFDLGDAGVGDGGI